MDLLKTYLAENAIYQYLYATLYPKFYSRNNKFGTESKFLFELCYKDWIDKASSNRNNDISAKNPENYKQSPSMINEVEQVLLMYNKYEFRP